MSEEPRLRGLPSIEEARKTRGKIRFPPVRFWAWVGLALAIALVFHWKRSQGEVESARQALMAKQRAVAAELGPRWLPLRDKIEGWTMALARNAGPDVVDKDALQGWEFRDKPGIYLRLRVDEAAS